MFKSKQIALIFLYYLFLIYSNSVQSKQLTEEDYIQLSEDKVWRLLLGFNKNSESSITSKEFFISPYGYKDAKAELKSTIRSFSLPQNGGQHAQCRFPARLLWLKSKIKNNLEVFKNIECIEYRKYHSDKMIRSVSLIFATGYLGNPASYYGHLLFKLNSFKKGVLDLENTAINYGARIPPDENMILYILKGIFGLYDSTFTAQSYYYHLHEYSDSELRDLWEYELELPAEATELLVAHTWEMLGVTHDYYFFNRNCAYRMAELIELVTDQTFTKDYLPWEAPQSVLQRLAEAKNNSRPIIKEVTYIPSKQSKLYSKYENLSGVEKSEMLKVIMDLQHLNSHGFSKLSSGSVIKILDSLTDYYGFISPNTRFHDSNEYRAIIAKRLMLPIHNINHQVDSNNTPHIGHSPSYMSVSMTKINKLNELAKLRIRPAYYDDLDTSYGHIKGAALSMMDLSVYGKETGLALDYLDLLSLRNMNSYSTGLPGDNPLAWNFKVSLEGQSYDCSSCINYVVRGGKGITKWIVQDNIYLSSLVQMGFEADDISDEGLFVGAEFGINIRMTDDIKAVGNILYTNFVNTDVEAIESDLWLRYEISTEMDMRFNFNNKNHDEISISVGRYW